MAVLGSPHFSLLHDFCHGPLAKSSANRRLHSARDTPPLLIPSCTPANPAVHCGIVVLLPVEDAQMVKQIRKAAVLGAGTMGSRIAAHLANAGVPCLLLDVPLEKGDSRASRNSLAAKALAGLRKSRPPALFTSEMSGLIEAGNFDDDLERIQEADWVIEAVVENFEAKRTLLAKVDQHRKKGSLVSSNTSGLPIGALAEGYSADFGKHWLGTHFFNPPRHMRLVEVIPGPDTNPDVVNLVSDFCDRRLGKVLVYAQDRPNFVANRIFLFTVMHTVKTMLEQGLSVEEVDTLTGPLIGRPRMATFRLADFTGIDVCLFIAETLHRLVPEDEKRDVYDPPDFLRHMVDEGMAGDKAGRGFYTKAKDGAGRNRLVLDLDSMEYRKPRPPKWPVLELAQNIDDAGDRIRFLVRSDDPAGRFLWATISELLLYTAARIPEITEDIVSVDTTMKAGFNWQLGIFEIWDRIGVEESVARMKKEKKSIPPLVQKVLRSHEKSFYTERNGRPCFFDLRSDRFKSIEDGPGTLSLSSIRRAEGVVESNESASLLDLGDGVACVEFHSKANSLDAEVFSLLEKAIAETTTRYEGLVIGNEGENFCVGANLMLLLELSREGQWDKIARAVNQLQELFRLLGSSKKPTVAAVFHQTLAGGCELALHCDRVQATAESYMGLVEVGAGLIPAAGGCTQLLRRHTDGLDMNDNLIPPTRTVFEKIGMARVSSSAAEAQQWRFLRSVDAITMNRDRLIADAKQAVLNLAAAGYEPTLRREVLVGGSAVLAALELDIYLAREGGYISDYDRHIGRKLAHVLAGGPLSQASLVSEDYLLDLEREAFLTLCGEEKTQQRMEHILKTGKPLRN